MALLDTEVISAEWDAALVDAQLGTARAVLLPAMEAGPEAPTSTHYAPGLELGADGLLSPGLAALANSTPDAHRIAVLCDLPLGELGQALLAAKLRHELEHARQWERWGSVPWQLSVFIDEAIGAVAGDDVRSDRMFYRAQPSEVDCNAAASTFVRRRFGEQVVATIIDSEDHVLVSALAAPKIETLPARSVAYLYQFVHVADCLTDPEQCDLRSRLGGISGRVLDFWDQLWSAGESWPAIDSA